MKKELLEKVLKSKKNLIVNGDLSSGKTSNVLLPITDELIKLNESLLIIDNKEEYLDTFYEKLKEKNYNIIIVNFKNLEKSEGWNPLDIPYKLYKSGNMDLSLEYLERIGKIMFYDKMVNDPFWSITASDFFTGVTIGLFEDGTENEINFNSVNMMFNGIDKKYGEGNYITEYFKTKQQNDPAYICASTTFLAPKETRGGILSIARQKLRTFVSREKLSCMLSKTTFNIADTFTKPTAIFVIGKEEQSTYDSLVSIFINQIFHELYLNTKQNYNFILDNIDGIEYIDEFEKMISAGLPKGIKTFIGTRSIENLNDKYSTYINKLCDTINVYENKIIVDNIAYEKNHFNYVKSNIEYPKININSIKIFDVEKFVKKYNTKPLSKIDNKEKNSNSSKNDPDIDELLKDIDKKIAELEKEEREKNNKSNN